MNTPLVIAPVAEAENAESLSITASFKWTQDEFVEAQRSHAASQVRPKPRLAFLSGTVLVLVGTLFIMLTRFLAADMFLLAVVVSGVCVLFLVSALLNGRTNLWSFRNAWRRSKLRDKNVLYRFTPDGFLAQEELSSASIRWEAFVKVVEAPCGFLVYPQANIFHWVPFHAFEEARDIEQVRQYIVHSQLPFKKLNAPRPN